MEIANHRGSAPQCVNIGCSAGWACMPSDQNFIYDVATSDEAARLMYLDIASSIERAFSRLGMQAVFEGSTGVIAVRVADERNLGTAYLELRDCEMRMRIVLFEDAGGAPTA